jgi:hypothetical protein
MSTFIEFLQKEINKILPEDYLAPQTPYNDADTFVGEASDEAKKIYTLREIGQQRADELKTQFKHERNPDSKWRLTQNLAAQMCTTDLWNTLFWRAIHHQYPKLFQLHDYYPNCDSVGIRERFEVVAYCDSTYNCPDCPECH